MARAGYSQERCLLSSLEAHRGVIARKVPREGLLFLPYLHPRSNIFFDLSSYKANCSFAHQRLCAFLFSKSSTGNGSAVERTVRFWSTATFRAAVCRVVSGAREIASVDPQGTESSTWAPCAFHWPTRKKHSTWSEALALKTSLKIVLGNVCG